MLALPRDDPRKGSLWIILKHRVEIDVFDALHMYALELHRLGCKRLGRVDPHFGTDAVVRGWVELRALGAGDDNEITVGLKAGRNGPFDFAFIVDIHAHVHTHPLLDVVVATECTHDDILRLALARLVDLDG